MAEVHFPQGSRELQLQDHLGQTGPDAGPGVRMCELLMGVSPCHATHRE